MSRIGKKPIIIPQGVDIKLTPDEITVKGPKGELKQKIHPSVKVEQADKQINLTVINPEEKSDKALWGLFGSVIRNMIIGVTAGYEKKLEVIGVGFKVSQKGEVIVLHVGYSHPVEYKLPKGISAEIDKNFITIKGCDKQILGETAAQLRRIRKPEPYKGKGIKYSDEIIRKKAGKTASKGEK
jgi:large subunit ribosomal protein L6